MSKKVINQNTSHDLELLNSIESNFIFNEKPLNRIKKTPTSLKNYSDNKENQLNLLASEINSIENCSLKNNCNKLILGDGNINSPIMIIGESPGVEEIQSGKTFMGETGRLLERMLVAINIKKENIYSTYSVNFRPPEDRKPSSLEIKKYSLYLKKHISIINPKIVILLGGTAMEALTGINSKISIERGDWKEIIVKNTSYNVIVTFNPSYLLRVPENKKHSWEDLKKIKKKIIDLKLRI